MYAARLRWGPLRLGYGSTLALTDAHAPTSRATVRRVAMPQLEGRTATWRNTTLQADARWSRDAAPIERCLLDGPDGAIRWQCHMPRAVARVQIGSTILEGLGYIEQLQLTIPPAKLPFRGGALRWGRYLSSRHAIVWIEWTQPDGHARQWAWLDGVERPGLASLDRGWRLVFHESRALRNQPLLATVGLPLPKLARRLAGVLAAAREHKRLSRAALVNGAGVLDEGWAIHEEVLW